VTLPIAVLVSGSGSNLQAIIDRIEAGVLPARITTVLSNKADAYGLTRAAKHGIATTVLAPAAFPDRAAYDAALRSGPCATRAPRPLSWPAFCASSARPS